MYIITLLILYIILSHIYFYKIWKRFVNEYDSERRWKEWWLDSFMCVTEERKNCELCPKDYI